MLPVCLSISAKLRIDPVISFNAFRFLPLPPRSSRSMRVPAKRCILFHIKPNAFGDAWISANWLNSDWLVSNASFSYLVIRARRQNKMVSSKMIRSSPTTRILPQEFSSPESRRTRGHWSNLPRPLKWNGDTRVNRVGMKLKNRWTGGCLLMCFLTNRAASLMIIRPECCRVTASPSAGDRSSDCSGPKSADFFDDMDISLGLCGCLSGWKKILARIDSYGIQIKESHWFVKAKVVCIAKWISMRILNVIVVHFVAIRPRRN